MMTKFDALRAVKKASLEVRDICAGELTKSANPTLALVVMDGRTIQVDTDYGSSVFYHRTTENCADRVLLKAGTIGMGFGAKQVTRTFIVRNDGTLNVAGMAKALAELAKLQQADVISRAASQSKQRQEHERSALAMGHLANMTGKFYNKEWDHLLRSDTIVVWPFELQITVKEDGNIKIVMDNLSIPSVTDLLISKLGFKKEDVPVKSDV